MKVRLMVPKDLDRVVELEALVFGQDAWDRELFQEQLSLASVSAYVVEERRKVLGYSVVQQEKRRVFRILSIGVHPEERRRGLGTALTNELFVAHVKGGRPGSYLRTMVLETNLPALSFFKAAGFRAVRIDWGRFVSADGIEMVLGQQVGEFQYTRRREPAVRR